MEYQIDGTKEKGFKALQGRIIEKHNKAREDRANNSTTCVKPKLNIEMEAEKCLSAPTEIFARTRGPYRKAVGYQTDGTKEEGVELCKDVLKSTRKKRRAKQLHDLCKAEFETATKNCLLLQPAFALTRNSLQRA